MKSLTIHTWNNANNSPERKSALRILQSIVFAEIVLVDWLDTTSV